MQLVETYITKYVDIAALWSETIRGYTVSRILALDVDEEGDADVYMTYRYPQQGGGELFAPTIAPIWIKSSGSDALFRRYHLLKELI